MQLRCALTLIVLGASMLAQSAPTACPADRPVDDIIAAVHKEQSKKNHRDPTVWPEVSCIFGWCFDHSRTPPTVPEPAPRAEMSSGGESAGTFSSSKSAAKKCDDAMELALEAAHNVDVGDYSFADRNYKGALLRYKDAVDQKPGDIGIHVRMGRVLEKLDHLPEAIEQYQAARELAGPKEWSDEAKAALLRLQTGPR